MSNRSKAGLLCHEIIPFHVIIMAGRKHIDYEQAKSIEEHYEMIMADESNVDSKYQKMTPDNLPCWFDEYSFRKGQQYFHNNLLSMILSYVTGTIAMLAIPSIANVFMSTKNSSTPCLAYRRYFKTEILVIDLHGDDVKNSGSRFYKSINTIRYMHSMVCKRVERNKQDGIKQNHLVFGLHGFTAYTLLKPQELGLTDTKEDREAYNHFWRVIGHLIGIPDKINVCRKNEYETTLLCEKILNEYMREQIINANTDFFYLTNAGVQGLQNVDPTLNTDAFLVYFYEINSIPYHGKVSWYSKMIYWYRKGVIKSFNIPIFAGASRLFWNKFIKFVLWLGVNYPILAWFRFGQKDSKLKLYPYSTI